MGHYDITLVLASFVVAVLAAYTAIYFGLRLGISTGRERGRWLALGGISLGSGIWTMHFVGMRAMDMGVEMSFDATLTLVSWGAAVLASFLALRMISLPALGRGGFLAATVAMATGIVVMHYLGMYAMRMSAPAQFDALWLLVSIVVALTASGGALSLCRRLVHGSGRLMLQFGAAVTMAVAICGMHYTGMLGMTFPPDAVPAADNLVRGEWMGIPLAAFCVTALALTLFLTVSDLRERRRLADEARAVQARVVERAFQDPATGLPNRSGLEQRLLEALARDDARQHPFALVCLDIANFRELNQRLAADALAALVEGLARDLSRMVPESATLARYSASAFFLMLPDYRGPAQAGVFAELRAWLQRTEQAGVSVLWRTGQAVFPLTGNSSRKLIRAAMVPRPSQELGRFSNVRVNPELVLPGRQRAS
ncbi:MHYT domain-containing protein [Marinobacter sp. C2H3]|uniref:MHYT domain-containing protein n=1 Tax=Marinobacter sp. C2H3 TaxID=3119003 RepID=UPI00300EE01C